MECAGVCHAAWRRAGERALSSCPPAARSVTCFRPELGEDGSWAQTRRGLSRGRFGKLERILQGIDL